MHAHGQVGIMGRKLALGAQQQIGQFVGGVLTVGSLPADGHGFPVGETGLGVHDPGRKRQLDELRHLAPHAAENFQGLLFRQHAGLHVLAVVGNELLIHAAVGNNAAGALFQAGERLREPVGLHGLMEGAGRILRHPFAAFRNFQKFLTARRVLFHGGLFPGQLGMAARPDHHGVAGEHHRFQEGNAVHDIVRVLLIQSLKTTPGIFLHSLETELQHLVEVQNPLETGTQRGGFRHHIAGLKPFLVAVSHALAAFGHPLEQLVMVGLAVPVRADLVDDDVDVLIHDADGGILAGGEIVQNALVEIPVQFGIQNAVAAVVPAETSHNELGILNIDRHFLRDIHQRLRPAECQMLSLGFPHGLGEIPGALHVDDGRSAVKRFKHVDDAGLLGTERTGLALRGVLNPLLLRSTATTTHIEHNRTPRKKKVHIALSLS